jgi:hypothetical protein
MTDFQKININSEQTDLEDVVRNLGSIAPAEGTAGDFIVVNFEDSDPANTLTGDEANNKDDIYSEFHTTQSRKELYDIVSETSKYILKKEISTVYFLDRSARFAAKALGEYWKYAQPDVDKPKLRFLNPKGFVSRQDCTADLYTSIELSIGGAFDKGLSYNDVRPEEAILEELQSALSRDGVKPTDQVMIYDTCMHSGVNARLVAEKFKALGFGKNNFHIGAAAAVNAHLPGIDIDFRAMKRRPDKSCIPFGLNDATSKSYASIFADYNSTPTERDEDLNARREIARIMQKYA